MQEHSRKQRRFLRAQSMVKRNGYYDHKQK